MIPPNQNKRVLLLMYYYVPRIHRGVVDYARRAGWILDAGRARSGSIPSQWLGDGIISFHDDYPEFVRLIRQSKVPSVELSFGLKIPKATRVLFDHAAIGRMAAEHLLSKGLKDIGFVDLEKSDHAHPHAVQRIAGMRAAVEAAGRRFFVADMENLLKLARKLKRPFGLMGHNDYVAERTMQLLIAAGYRVPADVAIIGADNDELFHGVAPVPLTSIDDNGEYVGYHAAEVLDMLMRGEVPPPSPIMIAPAHVVERESTDIIAITNKPTAKAVAWLRENFREPVSLDEASKQAGMCRRRLEDCFKLHIGHSMAKEQLRLRIAEACRRLDDPGTKVSVISSELGFVNFSHFSRCFRLATGQTPSEYRATRLAGRSMP
jgi:LacI family transcriptional regulator